LLMQEGYSDRDGCLCTVVASWYRRFSSVPPRQTGYCVPQVLRTAIAILAGELAAARACVSTPEHQRPSLIKSAHRSAIIMAATLVLARTTSGMIEASATRRRGIPWTRHHWSTTAMGSDAGPILHVPEM